MKKQLVIDIFNTMADILEIKGENPFRIRAYRRAALQVGSISGDITELGEQGRLTDIPGIGHDLAEKITEIIRTGSLQYYEELKKKIPQGVLDMLRIPGVGPRTAKLLFEQLHITSLEELEKTARAHSISGLPGIKDKTEENILKGIELIQKGKERMPLFVAARIAEEIIAHLEKLPSVKRISAAGSLRRQQETVRDIDILIASHKPEQVMETFVHLPCVQRVLSLGLTKSSILTNDHIQVDVRVVEEDSFGAALCYFTGSKAHNVHIRRLANLVGLKINEYGVFKEDTNIRLASKEEKDIYKTIDLPFIEPELREDRGEIEAAHGHSLPDLVRCQDIRGDLHMHTTASDGNHTIDELVIAAQQQGYSYIAITDHSASLSVAGGMSKKELLAQIAWIKDFNKKSKNFKIFTGCELEIKGDGSIDYDEEILSQLDVVIAAVHSGFKQSQDTMTQRILKGLSQSKCINIFAHPTGRLIFERDPYEVDLEKVMKWCAQQGIALEINACPLRLDLDDIHVKRARELGVHIVISSDTHTLDQMHYMRFGVSVARRGWCAQKDILNTYSYSQLIKRLHARRS